MTETSALYKHGAQGGFTSAVGTKEFNQKVSLYLPNMWRCYYIGE